MEDKQLVRLTTKVSFAAIFALVYWVFLFISITVFEFKVFRENITQSFYLSVLGILALLAGAMIVSVILNLSRIADAAEGKEEVEELPKKASKHKLIIYIATFPILFVLLYAGDQATKNRKEQYLVNSAKGVAASFSQEFGEIAEFSNDAKYSIRVGQILHLMEQLDESFPEVRVLVRDRIMNKEVFLFYNSWNRRNKPDEWEAGGNVFSTSADERKYLETAFKGSDETLFSASDGKYELYYPIHHKNGSFVLYFTNHARYGKIGS